MENCGRLPASAYKGQYAPRSPKSVNKFQEAQCTQHYHHATCVSQSKSHKLQLRQVGTGACILYGIKRVVIGENDTFLGGEAYLRQRGVEVIVLNDAYCKALMEKFIREKPQIWCLP